MNPIRLLAIAACMAALTGLATAQPARGPAAGPCAAASGASGPAADHCPASGPRTGMGSHARRGGRDDTPGWPMMSTEERRTHRDRLASFTRYEDCKAYMEQHHQEMSAHAQERGLTMPAQPRRDACAGLKRTAK
jgi:hypothetical protein